MTPKQITTIVIRLLIFYSFLRFVGVSFSSILAHVEIILREEDAVYLLLLEIVLFFVWIAVWGLLWKFAPRIAEKVLPAYSEEKVNMPQSPALWLNTGLVLMGIWMAVPALANLSIDLYYAFAATVSIGTSTVSSRAITYNGITMICGLALCLKPTLFSKLIRKVAS
ncbi:hypothetical protein [Neisseria zoodegmatis]|uniref:Integral membrane protein n=1 Tax=Neisseria zoodegmatis TaxID=326523 RepID=A0AB38DUK1_9NEIS|nr:hypothetical protein [Neisseria zoodegmatis]OSI11144.1 hypothetical protein BWD10_01655 [Neisseria zoodegmatis]SNU80573.1 Uncharacterised protein [Neisseria zoodegmatis]